MKRRKRIIMRTMLRTVPRKREAGSLVGEQTSENEGIVVAYPYL